MYTGDRLKNSMAVGRDGFASNASGRSSRQSKRDQGGQSTDRELGEALSDRS